MGSTFDEFVFAENASLAFLESPRRRRVMILVLSLESVGGQQVCDFARRTSQSEKNWRQSSSVVPGLYRWELRYIPRHKASRRTSWICNSNRIGIDCRTIASSIVVEWK